MNKNLCGRDGRTICGPQAQCVPKSTSVTLAVDEKTLPMADRRTDRVRRNMRPPPREEGRIKTDSWLTFLPDAVYVVAVAARGRMTRSRDRQYVLDFRFRL